MKLKANKKAPSFKLPSTGKSIFELWYHKNCCTLLSAPYEFLVQELVCSIF